MANKQVRLEPEVERFVESKRYEWSCSMTQATNRILRDYQRLESEPEQYLATAQRPGGSLQSNDPQGRNSSRGRQRALPPSQARLNAFLKANREQG